MLAPGTRFLPRFLAIVDEGKRVPTRAGLKSVWPIAPCNLGGGLDQCGENWMGAELAEPIGGISRIGLLPVEDAMPEASFRRREILNQTVTLVETSEVEPQSAECGFRRARLGKQVVHVLFSQKLPRLV